MVESKHSVYDDHEFAPLVAVEHLGPNADAIPTLDAYTCSHEDRPFVPIEAHVVNAYAEYQPSNETTSPTKNTNDNTTDEMPEIKPENIDNDEARQHELLVGASVGSGVVGCLLGGPILALLLGFGAAYAYEKEGALGDAVRAVGELSLSVRDKAKAINSKHHVVEKSQDAVVGVWEKAREVDQQHNILERTKELVVEGIQNTHEFVRRHQLIERGVESIGKAVFWTLNKVTETLKKKNDDGTRSEQTQS